MKGKTATLIFSLAVLLSFFFPLFEWHSFEMNGLNFILSTHIPSYKYFLLLIPFSTIFLFLKTFNEDSYFFKPKLISCVPFLTIIFILLARFINRDEADLNVSENFFSTIQIGFWLTLVFSLMLIRANGKMKMLYK